jgi:hypothetical protein
MGFERQSGGGWSMAEVVSTATGEEPGTVKPWEYLPSSVTVSTWNGDPHWDS